MIPTEDIEAIQTNIQMRYHQDDTLNKITDKLKCIHCGGNLKQEVNHLSCVKCRTSFNFVNGVPVLLHEDSKDLLALRDTDGVLMSREYKETASRPFQWLRRLITSEYFPSKGWKKARQRTIGKGNLLVIGSGVTQYPDAVHLDLDAFPGVDVIADAMQLPFKDHCFDAVLCEVVLEHVYQPQKVIEEVFRILKPNGCCFFIVPFLFPYHGHPSDYRRWSVQGLKTEFSMFDHLETGIHGGPSSSLVNLISEWVYIITGLTYPRGYTLFKGGATALLFPLKFLDIILNRFPEAHRLASTLYIYAKKQEKTCSTEMPLND